MLGYNGYAGKSVKVVFIRVKRTKARLKLQKLVCESDHLAVASQNQNHHKEASDELTKAAEVSSIPKIHLQWDLRYVCCVIACSSVGRRVS